MGVHDCDRSGLVLGRKYLGGGFSRLCRVYNSTQEICERMKLRV